MTMNTELQNALRTLEQELNKKYINRTEVIHGLLVTLLARGNCVLLGAAGTGKSDMVQTLSRAINGKCFETILTKTSSPEELFGAYDIAKLQEGKYVRNTENTLVDSDIAFVDEIFKSNAAVLNGLLGVMAQRTFRNGSAAPEDVPLQMFVGASNEMPEGGADGQLAAMWDRCELRFVVDYIRDKGSFHRLLNLSKANEPKTKINLSDIHNAASEIDNVDIGSAEELIVSLWEAFAREGYKLSDRKWRNSLRYMKANAWLNGRSCLNDEDVSIIKDMAWAEPSQIKAIRKLVFNTLNPALSEAQDLYDAACEVFSQLQAFSDDDVLNKQNYGTNRMGKAVEVNSKLTSAKKMITTIIVNQAGRNTSCLESYVSKIDDMIKEVMAVMLGRK